MSLRGDRYTRLLRTACAKNWADVNRDAPIAKKSAVMSVIRGLIGILSAAATLLLTLCVLMAVGWHVSDPADPSKVAVIVALDLFFLVLSVWAFRKP